MKKLMLTVCLVLGLIIAPMAMADQLQIGYSGFAYGAYQTGVGGEFTVNPVNPTGWLDLSAYGAATKDVGVTGTFQTFCIEGLEYISGYPSIYTAVLSTKAMYGSVGPAGDPLSVGAAWLYSQFGAATLANYDYSDPGRSGAGNSADLLQRAIWWLEGEEGIVYNASNAFMLAVVTQFGTQDGAKANYTGGYGVYVINLTDAGGGRAQDLLVDVPEPGILILLGIAMSAIGAASWRIRKL